MDKHGDKVKGRGESQVTHLHYSAVLVLKGEGFSYEFSYQAKIQLICNLTIIKVMCRIKASMNITDFRGLPILKGSIGTRSGLVLMQLVLGLNNIMFNTQGSQEILIDVSQILHRYPTTV